MTLLDSGLILEVDWDNDGDFDEAEENITSFVYTLEAKTGRDWPSQLTGKAGPGLLKVQLDNRDNRFAHYNTASPLNAAPFSLKTGRKARLRVAGAETDPALLAKDRFGRAAGAPGATENGLTWTNHGGAVWEVADQRARVQVETDDTGALVDGTGFVTVDVATQDMYAQCTVAHLDSANTAGLLYRFVDVNNFGGVLLEPGASDSGSTVLHHYEVTAGVFVSTGVDTIETQADTTIGVLVVNDVVTVYLNGVPWFTVDAYASASTVVGLFGEWTGGRVPAVDDFYVWEGLAHDLAGVLWTGDVSDLHIAVSPGDPSTATLNGEGWLAKAAATDIDPPESIGVTTSSTFGVLSVGQYTGELVGKTLAKAQLLHPPGPIERGDVLAGSVGLTQAKALTVARQFEEVEFGFLYETPAGPIGFDSRTARDASYSLVTFSDAPGPGELGYESIKPYDWRREIVNQVSAGQSPVPPDTRTLIGAGINNAVGVDTNVNVPLPTGSQVSVGDLVIVIITPSVGPATGQRWITPRDWVAFNPSEELGRVRIYAKVLAEDDLGTTVQFYNDLTPFGGSYAYTLIPISLWYGDIAQGIAVAAPNVLSGAPAVKGRGEVPVLFPPWGKETSLFIALRSGMQTFGTGGFVVSGTGPPNGYRQFRTSTVTGTSDAFDLGIERAFSAGNSEVEAPGPFTGRFENFVFVEHNLIAVRGFNGRPPPAGGVQTVEVVDLASQDEHNAVRSHRNPANLFRSRADATTYSNLVLARYADDRPIFSITYTATASAAHLEQAVARRVSDRVTLVANNDTGLSVNGDFHIESIAHKVTRGGKLWSVTYELSPAEAIYRADTGGSVMGIPVAAGDTMIRVDTVVGRPWISSFIRPNMFPIPVRVGTEVMRLLSNTSDPDNTSPQFYNVERGVDGTTATAHLAGVPVSLAYPWQVP